MTQKQFTDEDTSVRLQNIYLSYDYFIFTLANKVLHCQPTLKQVSK